MLERIVHKLKMRYSPSYRWRYWGRRIVDGFAEGIVSDKPFEGFTPEVWAMLERSAKLCGGGKGMNVAELREWLKPVPGNWQVLLASDSEGNNFSPLAEPGTLICRIINTLEIECV
ncbi:MAG: hypothetical protein ABIH46_07935, partial [Chloroflexota bacterium]